MGCLAHASMRLRHSDTAASTTERNRPNGDRSRGLSNCAISFESTHKHIKVHTLHGRFVLLLSVWLTRTRRSLNLAPDFCSLLVSSFLCVHSVACMLFHPLAMPHYPSCCL